MQPSAEQDLVHLSQYAAGDVLLVQGGGGNTSVKSPNGRRMWIKASGLRLSEIGPKRGYLETDLPALLGVLRDPALALLPRGQAHEESVQRIQRAVLGNGHLRPSLETTFHAILGAAVLHTHPVYVNAFTCMAGGATALADILGTEGLWTQYEPPGFALGAAVDRAAQAHQAAKGAPPEYVILANHGLIASGASPSQAIATTRRLVTAGQRYFGPLPGGAREFAWAPAHLQRWAQGLQRALSRLPGRKEIEVRASRRAALLEAANNPEQWLTGGPLVPDDVVYGGRAVFLADESEHPARWLGRLAEPAPERLVIAVRGLGVVLAGPNVRTVEAMEENLLAHVLVRWLIAARRGQARPLPPGEIEYLSAMESEKYRQAVVGQR